MSLVIQRPHRLLSQRDDTRSPRWLWVAAVVMASLLGIATLLRHLFTLSTGYDMGFYVHVVSQLSRGHWMNNMFGFHVFADHFSPLLILLAPLGWGSPAEGLLVVQALVVGFGIVPAYRLGRARGGDGLGRLCVVWYGLSASVWHTVFYDFRPSTLGVVALLWIIAELETRGRMSVIVILTAAAAASREDVAVLTGLALVIFAWAERRKPLIALGVGAAAVGFWYTMVGQRLFAPFDYFLWYRFADYGESPSAVLSNLEYVITTAPARLGRDTVVVAVAALLIPFLIIGALRGWRYSWPAYLIILSNAVSADPLVPSIQYQYYLAAVVFLIWGGAHAFAFGGLEKRRVMAGLATAAIFVVMGPIGAFLSNPDGRSLIDIASSSDRRAVGRVVSTVPAEESVSAGMFLLPHLADRENVKPYPAPLICSTLLLTYHPQTSFPTFVVVERSDIERYGIDPAAMGYELAESTAELLIWESTGSHPAPSVCPSVDEARKGMFDRVMRQAME